MRIITPTLPIKPPPGNIFFFDAAYDRFCSTLQDRATNSKPGENLLLSPSMNVDTDEDGVVDNFVAASLPGVTAVYTLDDSSQKINITNSTAVHPADAYQLLSSCIEGDVISAKCRAKITSGMQANLLVGWYDSSNTFLSASDADVSYSTSYADLEVNGAIAPSGAAKTSIISRLMPVTAGNTGSGWFNTAELYKGNSAIAVPDPHYPITLNNITWQGGMPYFDGSTSYGTITHNSNLDVTEVTAEKPLIFGMVFKCTADTSGFIFHKSDDTTGTIQYGIYRSLVTDSIQYWISNANRITIVNNSVLVNNWYFSLLYWDGTNIYHYLNGKLISTDAYANAKLTSRSQIKIGDLDTFEFEGFIPLVFMCYGAKANDISNWAKQVNLYDRFDIRRAL